MRCVLMVEVVGSSMAELGCSALVVEATGSATATLPSSALLVEAAESASAMPHSFALAVKEAVVSTTAEFCSSVLLVDVVALTLVVGANAGLVLAPEAVCLSVSLVYQLLALFLAASLVH